MAEMADWIGKEVRSAAPVRFGGGPVILSPNPATGATGADLVVRDMQGRLIAREAIPLGTAPYTWLGADATGSPLPPGTYQLSLESRSGQTVLSTNGMEHYSRVLEVRTSAGGAKLVLEGGIEVSADQVTALRDAGG